MRKLKLSEKHLTLPFGMNELTAGLRRTLGDLSIEVHDAQPFPIVHKQPSISRVYGLKLALHSRSGDRNLRVVAKEPRGITRTGQAGAGKREVGVYRSLAEQLPFRTPELIASDSSGDWLVLEYVSGYKDPADWTAGDYMSAAAGLVDLHDRFWDLGKDLMAFQWLARPLDTDFEVHVGAAANSIENMVYGGKPQMLAGDPAVMNMLADLTIHAVEIGAVLVDQPRVLLHGSYWPGNIAMQDGKKTVLDWAHAAAGPALLDLVVFCKKSAWLFSPLPVTEAELVGAYREGIRRATGYQWTEERWGQVWDAALMWIFIQDWLDLLAVSPDSLLESRRDLLERIWFEPVRLALGRLLEGLQKA